MRITLTILTTITMCVALALIVGQSFKVHSTFDIRLAAFGYYSHLADIVGDPESCAKTFADGRNAIQDSEIQKWLSKKLQIERLEIAGNKLVTRLKNLDGIIWPEIEIPLVVKSKNGKIISCQAERNIYAQTWLPRRYSELCTDYEENFLTKAQCPAGMILSREILGASQFKCCLLRDL